MLIPHRQHLIAIDEEDPLPYYYAPVTGYFYRQRLRMACAALGTSKIHALLEIGYGSGIFLPELARRAERVIGSDLHHRGAEVRQSPAITSLKVDLLQNSLPRLSFSSGSFDAVVCISVLEHMNPVQLEQALSDIRRVAADNAVVVLGFPTKNIMMNSFFRLAGFRPDDLHPAGHTEILAAVRKNFSVVKEQRFPAYLPANLALYVTCRCQK